MIRLGRDNPAFPRTIERCQLLGSLRIVDIHQHPLQGTICFSNHNDIVKWFSRSFGTLPELELVDFPAQECIRVWFKQFRLMLTASYHSFLTSYSPIFFVLSAVHSRTMSCRRLYIWRTSVTKSVTPTNCMDMQSIPLRDPKVIEIVRIAFPSGALQTIVSLPTIWISRLGTGLRQISCLIQTKEARPALTILMKDPYVINWLCSAYESGSSIFQTVFDRETRINVRLFRAVCISYLNMLVPVSGCQCLDRLSPHLSTFAIHYLFPAFESW